MTTALSIDDLARRLVEPLGDRVLRPGHEGYVSASNLWNGAVTTRAALVVRPGSNTEVAASVTAARESDDPLPH